MTLRTLTSIRIPLFQNETTVLDFEGEVVSASRFNDKFVEVLYVSEQESESPPAKAAAQAVADPEAPVISETEGEVEPTAAPSPKPRKKSTTKKS